MNERVAIRQICAQRGVSLSELARRLGRSRQAISEQLKVDSLHDMGFRRVEMYLDALGYEVVFRPKDEDVEG